MLRQNVLILGCVAVAATIIGLFSTSHFDLVTGDQAKCSTALSKYKMLYEQQAAVNLQLIEYKELYEKQ